jgi:fructose 1,6-bisphosphatase
MRNTLSIIKADVGSVGGHVTPSRFRIMDVS